MQTEIRSPKNCPISAWAGGFTTELWIWPPNGNYALRNFSARISSATVRIAESDFTALPDVLRYITPLTGQFTLSHPDGTTITLSSGDEPYCFDGGIATHCSGTATDFNLMLKGTAGVMMTVHGKETFSGDFCCVYPLNGASVALNGRHLPTHSGDLVVIRLEPNEKAVVESAAAIVCSIRF